MALTRSLAQLRTRLRYVCDIGGTTPSERHPDANLNEALLHGISALHRKLRSVAPGKRFLDSTSIATVAGQRVYSLPADFRSLISVELLADGHRSWLDAHDWPERPALTDPDQSYTGIPYSYALHGANIEFLPIAQGVYTVTLWYVPDAPQPTSDASTIDTIEGLDDYIIAYAGLDVARRDARPDLYQMFNADLARLEQDILVQARSLDLNSPARMVDTTPRDRFGRSRR
jgi:hypothetical protein